jgi:hypothetical protein
MTNMTGSKLSIFSHPGKITGYWITTRSFPYRGPTYILIIILLQLHDILIVILLQLHDILIIYYYCIDCK